MKGRLPFPAASILAALLAASGTASTPAPVASAARRGMEMLHEGKISLGQDVLESNAAAHPSSRTALFYAGVGLWWRHIAEFGNESAAARAMVYFERALAAGEVDEEDSEALFEAGTAWLLLSHLQGGSGSVLKAGRSAKKGKELLELAAKKDPKNRDVGFGLGAYDYYADRLPKIMKGLRALLLLPGGNASRGIAELESASKGSIFGCEASLVLADILASGLEGKYELGLDILTTLVDRHPENPFFLTGRAEILSSVGEHERALADVERALEHVAGEDETMRAGVLFEKARVHDAGFDTASAVKVLEPLVSEVAGKVPKTQHARMRFALGEMWERLGDARALPLYRELSSQDLDARLSKKVRKKLDGDLPAASRSYKQCQEAVALLRAGRPGDAQVALRSLLEKSANDPILLYFSAECRFAEGERSEVKAAYDRAFSLAGKAHPWVAGWCLVRLGDIALSLGQRDEAFKRYGQAGVVDRWRRGGIVAYRLEQASSFGKPAASRSASTAPPSAASPSR